MPELDENRIRQEFERRMRQGTLVAVMVILLGFQGMLIEPCLLALGRVDPARAGLFLGTVAGLIVVLLVLNREGAKCPACGNRYASWFTSRWAKSIECRNCHIRLRGKAGGVPNRQ